MSGTSIKALFFDQDGVIIDTERDGHRVAFNRAFAQLGLNVEWSIEHYHRLLQVGGGKERMRAHFDEAGWPAGHADRDALIRKLHEVKTRLFVEMLGQRALPLRPGVHRIMREASQRGVMLAICTTSNENVAQAIVSGYLPDIPFKFVLAGDVVPKKKPDPAIYRLALSRAEVAAEEALVIEDSHIGISAARAAGCRVVATANGYTQGEDLSAASLRLSCLGDASEPARSLDNGQLFACGEPLLDDLFNAIS